MSKNKVIFLDRDGVIMKDIGHLTSIKDIKFLPQIFSALKHAFNNNYKLIIITNQSVVGRGLITTKELKEIHDYIKKKFISKKIKIHDIFFCPHHPKYGIGKYKKKCKCRKPGNLLIEKAIKKYNIDRDSSLFIGDKVTDKIASKKSQVKFLFRSKNLFLNQIIKFIAKKKLN